MTYHPQANGLVERFHRHLKSTLRARLRTSSWADELPGILLGIRTAPKDDLQNSSAKLVYVSPLTVPGDFTRTPLDPSTEFKSVNFEILQDPLHQSQHHNTAGPGVSLYLL